MMVIGIPEGVKVDTAIDIDIAEDVYNPSDDSFLLVNVMEVNPGDRVLDMGTGTGIAALHAAKAGAKVTAADINPHAVACARSNALRNDLKVDVVESDLFQKVEGLYDVITFNPPYLPEEGGPSSWMERAWSGGADGSEVVARFLEDAWRFLAPGGRVYIILSSFGSIRAILRTAKERYDIEMVEEKHMFFESILAYRMKAKTSAL
jgi:release factor glutamine methyltransferase